MSKFKQFQPRTLRDYSLLDRPSKVSASEFARTLSSGSVADFVESLPNILAARDFRLLIRNLQEARRRRKAIIWGFGGHVIKVGLGPVLVDLIHRGYVTAMATNGSGVIHDFEIAFAGHTSEDVERELKEGSFGMARETGQLINQAIVRGASQDRGIGEALCDMLAETPLRYPEYSVVKAAGQTEIPLTVHVALGTDIIHSHPSACGASIGKGTLMDFRIFTQNVAELNDGGVYLNLGSAVILPEVFLKAVSIVRNTGQKLKDFTTANLDFIQHYRPTQNVVRRPVADCGTGLALTGHHEIMIPLLAAALAQTD